MLAYPNKSPDEQPIASHRDRSIVRLKLRWDIVYGDPIPAHYQAINPLSYYRFTEPSKAFSGCASLHEARQVPGTHTNSKNHLLPVDFIFFHFDLEVRRDLSSFLICTCGIEHESNGSITASLACSLAVPVRSNWC